jgi:hypothetical protein
VIFDFDSVDVPVDYWMWLDDTFDLLALGREDEEWLSMLARCVCGAVGDGARAELSRRAELDR